MGGFAVFGSISKAYIHYSRAYSALGIFARYHYTKICLL
jgi:hypothetical protein